MAKSSPRVLVSEASSPASEHQRAKFLSRSHESSLRKARECNRPLKSHSAAENTSQLDSANLVAAKMLYSKRIETGLTQEELASLTGESRKQVHRRESNKAHLGALRSLVVLERAASLKVKK